MASLANGANSLAFLKALGTEKNIFAGKNLALYCEESYVPTAKGFVSAPTPGFSIPDGKAPAVYAVVMPSYPSSVEILQSASGISQGENAKELRRLPKLPPLRLAVVVGTIFNSSTSRALWCGRHGR